MQNPRRTLIGLAVIALIAFLLVAMPSGGVAMELVNNSIQAAFLVLIAYSLTMLYRSQADWLGSLSDRDRGIVYGAVAVGLLSIIAVDRFRDLWNGGIVLVVLILAACGGSIWWVWRESRRWVI